MPLLPTLATASPATAPYTPYMYGLGAHLARSTGLCSADMLCAKLALSPSAARAMFNTLLRDGIIAPPNTAGLAVATHPYMATIRFKSTAALVRKSIKHAVQTSESEMKSAFDK